MHPHGHEMTADDWHDDGLHTVGMFVSGDPLRSPGPRGEQLRDSSFVIWLNAAADDVEVRLPENAWVDKGEVVLSTCDTNPVGTPVSTGGILAQGARSVIVLREVKP
jgi:glycogen operon protein